MAFTGTADEIAFKAILARVIARNELGDKSPYELHWAGTPSSGWSFSIVQFDVAGNATGRDLLARILLNATDANGDYIVDDGDPDTERGSVGNVLDTAVQDLLQGASTVGGAGLTAAEKALIDTALQSDYGTDAIDSAVDPQLTTLMSFATRTTCNVTNSADQAFLKKNLGKLFLCDFANQYSTKMRGVLQTFLQGNVAQGISIEGDLGVDDLLNFYFRTPNSQRIPWDPLRRFAAIVAETGYTPTDSNEARNVFRAATFLIHGPGRLNLIRSRNEAALNRFVASVLNPARTVLLAAVQTDYQIPDSLLARGYHSLSILIDPTLPGVNPNSEAVINSQRFDAQGAETSSNDLLIGEGGIDTLSSGLGNDILIGGTGNDYLRGGHGDDVYVYRTGDGTDWINDSGRDGSIVFDGIVLTGAGAVQWVDGRTPTLPAWRAVIEGRVFYFTLHDARIDPTGALTGDLWIQAAGAADHQQIIVEGFEIGDLGLDLPANPLLMWYVPNDGIISNPFSQPTLPPPFDSVTLIEGMAQTLPLAWNTPAAEGQICRITCTGAPSLVLVTGDQVLEFVNGYIDLVLSAGQTQLLLSLVSRGNIDDDVSGSLTAVFLDRDGNPTGGGATLSINVTARDEDLVDPLTTNTIDAHDPNSVQGPRGAYTADFYGTGQNDLVLTRSAITPGGSRSVVDEQGGNDDMRGGDGVDQLIGGAGNDSLSGGAFIDWLHGDLPNGSGNGDDMLAGGSGSDLLVGNGGNDQLWADERSNQATAIADAEAQGSLATRGDFLLGEDGDDLLIGSSGFDILAGGNGRDVLAGGGGDDLLVGDLSYNFIYNVPVPIADVGDFDWGWSVVRGQSTQPDGSVRYTFTINDSSPYTAITAIPEDAATGAADRLHGGAGNDGIFAGYGDDFADGGAGDDAILGGVGNDTLLGGAGVDMLVGGDAEDAAGKDFIDGGADDDTIFGGHAADVLYGGGGNDYIYGDDSDDALAGDDYINGEDGNDLIAGAAGADALYGGAGNDSMYGDFSDTEAERQGDDFMDGGAGNDVLVGEGGSDTLIGGEGDDDLHGESTDTPLAVHGDDYLDGGLGDDLLMGEGGSDMLFGGAGNDDLYGESSATPESAQQADHLDGGEGNDVLVGGGGSDTLLGGAGNDQLSGDASYTPVALHGDDYMDGGAGEDTLQGRGGRDTLLGGEDRDVLSGGEGDDYLDGGEGNDELHGGAGNDVLRGGVGADVLLGGAGDDIYIFDENDLIVSGGLADGVIDTEGFNQLVFQGGFTLDTVSIASGTQAGSLSLSSGTLGLVVRNALSGSVGSFVFADGSIVSAFELIGSRYNVNVNQTSDADGVTLIGGSLSDNLVALGNDTILSGGLGNDQLTGGAGSTTYHYDRGHGRDVIDDVSTFAQSGNVNTLVFGEAVLLDDLTLSFVPGSGQLVIALGDGDEIVLSDFSSGDVLNGPRTLDRFSFADGSTLDWAQLIAARGITITNPNNLGDFSGTNVNDVLLGSSSVELINGGAGDDIIDGGGGNDVVSGGQGSDIYILRQGSGADTINNFDNASGKVDRLLIDISIAPSAVEFFRIGQSLLVRVRDSADQVLISDYFGAAALDEIQLADGTKFTAANVPWQEQADNTVVYELGQGHRNVAVSDPIGMLLDTLRFGVGIDPHSVMLQVENNGNLVIRFSNAAGQLDSNNSLTLVGAFLDTGSSFNRFVFDAEPGLTWTLADIRARFMTPTVGDDLIFGTSNNDTIAALDGTNEVHGVGGDDVLVGGQHVDRLYGGAGSDTLSGGHGTNTLDGGAGSDTFIVAVDEGATTIEGTDADSASNDVLLLGPGIDHQQVVLQRQDDDLWVIHTNPADASVHRVTIRGFYNATLAGRTVDEIRFTDAPSVVWTHSQIISGIGSWISGDDSIAGGNDGNVFSGYEGDDSLTGGLLGDTLSGDAGSDWLAGRQGDDTLRGGEGRDDLYGESGDDQLDGGSGDDFLFGGSGSDRYVFNLGFGDDVLTDEEGYNDRVEFGPGILPSDITVYKQHFESTSSVLVLRLASGDELRIRHYFAQQAYIEQLIFADGTVWQLDDINQRAIDLTPPPGAIHTGTAGNDSFYINYTPDTIVEAANGGTDTVYATVNYTLSDNVENLVLQGSANINGTGNGGNNIITGNAGNNVLATGQGVDTLIGGAGDDTYHIENMNYSAGVDDTVVEQANGGYDTVIVSRGRYYVLADNVEHLIYETYRFDGGVEMHGNALDNVIEVIPGFYLEDIHVRIDGGLGADTMIGRGVPTTYVVDNAGDVVIDVAVPEFAGDDTVEASVSYTLPDHVERLVLTGNQAIVGTGNSLDNWIDGYQNENGNLLMGGGGNDTYQVGAGDTVLEHAGGGIDTVHVRYGASAYLSNYAGVENAQMSTGFSGPFYGDANANTLIGHNATGGVGDQLYGGGGDDIIKDQQDGAFISADNDSLYGEAGNDVIESISGADLLDGGAGDDRLITRYTGSGGEPTVAFGAGYDYDTVEGGALVRFNAGVATGDVKLVRDGEYVYAYLGTTDRIRVRAFADATATTFAAGFAGFAFNNGTTWNAAQVLSVIQSSTNVVSAGNDTMNGTAAVDRIDGLGGNDTLSGLGGDDRLEGNAGNDTLNGGQGADALIGGAGNDVLRGGSGADRYYFSAGFGLDIIRDTDAGQLQDTAIDRVIFDSRLRRSEFAFTRSETNSADLWVTRRGTADRIVVENFFAEPTSGDRIERFEFADGTVVTAEELRGMPIVEGTSGNDVLQATSVGTIIYGYAGNDTLNGGAGADILDGGSGVDTMSGGGGDDLYRVDDTADVVSEAANGGVDTIDSSVSYVLASNIEQLRLTGDAAINATGNALANRLVGNSASNFLDGRAGADTMTGAEGNDTYIVDDALDVVQELVSEGYDTIEAYVSYILADDVEALNLQGTANLDAIGNAQNNYLRGNDGHNLLDGAAGVDMLVGGLGDDRYVIDNVSDIVVEGVGAGSDTIATSVSYRASDNIENVELLGAAAINASGNAAANTLQGNAADNVLDGEGGADLMRGGAGNDTYVIDVAGDAVVELADGGIDRIISAIDYQLGDHLEGVRLIGEAMNAIGNALDNTIEGNSQGNFIDGGMGNDAMSGGMGDDTYIVEAAGDTVTEMVDGGIDSVRSDVTFTLGANIEQLVLTGTAAVDATGNALANNLIGNTAANTLTGDAGNDLLDGGGGTDTMRGGAGDDVYITDGGDTLSELLNEGVDLVRSSATHVLLNNFENLELLGTANINGTGNSSANQITGNAGNNTLNGGSGVDTMTGGAGNDIYVVDNVGDVVTELAGEGIDTVQASASYTLSSHVENLTLTGSSGFSGTGNELDNILLGNGGANQLSGGAGNDVLNGGAGNDTMNGGEGDDAYFVTEAGDVIVEGAGGGTDSVTSSIAYTLSANVENLTLTGTSNINATGNDSANVIVGSDGNNNIDGGGGADSMSGGLGNDTYVVDNVADVIVEAPNAGVDNVQASVSYTLSEGIENITLTGSAVGATGNALDNVITSNTAANVLSGGAGNDTYVVQSSDDAILEAAGEGVDLVQSSATYALSSNVENLALTGTAAINGTGNELVNILTGNSAANVLDGGSGADSMSGAAGDDTYLVDDAGDVIIEASNAGTDSVLASVTYTLSTNVERLTLTGTAAIDGTGNTLANIITGNAAANVLNGGTGTDTMIGGAGDDTYIVDVASDVVTESAGEGIDLVMAAATYTLSAEVENLTLTGSSGVNGTGNQLDNRLFGNSGGNTLYGLGGNDVLDGGAGNDRMEGGLGDDVYYVSETGDTIVEAADAGFDVVLASATTTLSVNVENLTLTGTSAINGTGNALANVITGNAAANQINGGAGADTLIGMGGDDVYVVDVASDIVIENANEGIDTIQTGFTFTLMDNVENLTLTGSAVIDGTGNALDNIIIGNSSVNNLLGDAGNDTLNGGGGADRMTGGSGDDTYVVDVAGDVVVEEAGGGVDTVQSTIAYTLGAELENLTLTGSGSVNATGNAAANVLIGNSGANTLNGGAGADTMSGGAGNDIYVIDDAGDTVTELVDGGVDTVQSAISYVLGANVENLTLTGTANINATGNELANILTGNAGANVLTGGAGDDTLVIDNAGDVIVENAGEGIDTVQSSLTYVLGANLENLTLSGSAAIHGTGNEYDNILIGNSAANTLTGGVGNDTLDGAAGNDQLIGGAGDDTYLVNSASDVVTELAGQGVDLVQSTASTYTLANEVENLTLMAGNISGTGNSANNILIGSTGANTLNGGAGADTMIGGAGNDIYVVDVAGDVVTELADGGTDTVQSVIGYVLGANVENLTLTGAANINGTGNELANVLTGNSGSNVLAGLLGDDTYMLDSSVDTIVEAAGEGIDTVQTAASYTLLDNFENLILTGSAAVNGTGNSTDNVLTGNTGANALSGGEGNDTLNGGNGVDTLTGGTGNDTLNGGAGADTMIGGTGNDAYSVDNAGDVVTEQADEGIDTVTSTVAYNLGNHLENLTLGTGALTGSGNELDNVLIGNGSANTLTGNGGNDTLEGGAGNDTMIGGAGDDTYVVAQAGDITTENANEGTDTVQSSATFTLSANVERLFLSGTSSISGTGNELANYISGNAAANTLTGMQGDDLLAGGNGADIYSYSADHGADTIENFSTDALQDRLVISNLTRAEFTFSQDGDDLLMSRNGSTTDSVRVAGWFIAAAHQLDIVQFSDEMLTAAQINALIPPGLMGGDIPAEASQAEVTQNIEALFAAPAAGNPTTAIDHLLEMREEITRDWGAKLPLDVSNDDVPLNRWLAVRNHMWQQPSSGFIPLGGEEMPLPAASLLAAGEAPWQRPPAMRDMAVGMRSRGEALV